MRPSGMRSTGWMETATAGRKSISRSWRATPRSCRWELKPRWWWRAYGAKTSETVRREGKRLVGRRFRPPDDAGEDGTRRHERLRSARDGLHHGAAARR